MRGARSRSGVGDLLEASRVFGCRCLAVQCASLGIGQEVTKLLVFLSGDDVQARQEVEVLAANPVEGLDLSNGWLGGVPNAFLVGAVQVADLAGQALQVLESSAVSSVAVNRGEVCKFHRCLQLSE